MTKQLLIYEQAIPVSSQRHGDWSVKTGKDYEFSREVNSVPLLALEFPGAASEYAIVFAGGEETVMPAVILGVKDGQNLYLTETGGWDAKYVPAFLRRYPFVFSGSDDGERFALCIDEDFAGCNQEGRGERLFDSEGEYTQYLRSVLEFLKGYQAQFRRTQAFCKKLKDLDLLESMQAQFTLGTGEQVSLAGFFAINRDRLKALTGDQLAELARTDELELMYMHLQSMRNFTAMVQRVNPPAAAEAEEGSDDTAPVAQESAEAPPADEKPPKKGQQKS